MDNIEDVVRQVVADLQTPSSRRKQCLLDKWPSIVGSRLAPHTKPLLQESGRLIVWVDDSSLAFELSQRYQEVLVKRVRAELGEEAVRSVRFYVGQIR